MNEPLSQISTLEDKRLAPQPDRRDWLQLRAEKAELERRIAQALEVNASTWPLQVGKMQAILRGAA